MRPNQRLYGRVVADLCRYHSPTQTHHFAQCQRAHDLVFLVFFGALWRPVFISVPQLDDTIYAMAFRNEILVAWF